MSIASLGIAGGLASSGFSQRAAETDKLPSEAAERGRAAEATERAENAAGIGQTQEDSQTAERDADGRRLWEQPAKRRPAEPPTAVIAAPFSKDPTGTCGQQLDLTG